MSSNARKSKESGGGGADSEESNSVSSKPGDDIKQPRLKGSDTSSSLTASYPSSTSAPAATASAQPAAEQQPVELPSLPAAAAAAAPVVRQRKPRRAGFREQFLQKVKTKKRWCAQYVIVSVWL